MIGLLFAHAMVSQTLVLPLYYVLNQETVYLFLNATPGRRPSCVPVLYVTVCDCLENLSLTSCGVMLFIANAGSLFRFLPVPYILLCARAPLVSRPAHTTLVNWTQSYAEDRGMIRCAPIFPSNLLPLES